MFGFIADLISSVISILLPAYLSYKSLRTSDPAQTTPWLIYFIILSLSLLFESWTVFIIGWFPFYSWFRLFFLLYLVLPQTQGAKFLYLTYVEPYIVTHEKNIDQFIGDVHQQLEAVGLGYLNILVEWIRDKILGQASPQPQHQRRGTSSTSAAQSYASDLLSRFAMPNARTNAAQATGLTGLLSAALSATTSSASGRTDPTGQNYFDISSLQSLLSNPSTSSAEKASVIQTHRERLTTLMKTLDKEQQSLDLAYGSGHGSHRHERPQSGFPKSLSQQSFERVDYDDLPGSIHTPGSSQQSTPPRSSGRRTDSSGFMGGWLSGNQEPSERRDDEDEDMISRGWSAARDVTEAITGSEPRHRRHG